MLYGVGNQIFARRLYDTAGAEVTGGATSCYLSKNGGAAVSLAAGSYVSNIGWVLDTGDAANTAATSIALSWENSGAIPVTENHQASVDLQTLLEGGTLNVLLNSIGALLPTGDTTPYDLGRGARCAELAADTLKWGQANGDAIGLADVANITLSYDGVFPTGGTIEVLGRIFDEGMEPNDGGGRAWLYGRLEEGNVWTGNWDGAIGNDATWRPLTGNYFGVLYICPSQDDWGAGGIMTMTVTRSGLGTEVYKVRNAGLGMDMIPQSDGSPPRCGPGRVGLWSSARRNLATLTRNGDGTVDEVTHSDGSVSTHTYTGGRLTGIGEG